MQNGNFAARDSSALSSPWASLSSRFSTQVRCGGTNSVQLPLSSSIPRNAAQMTDHVMTMGPTEDSMRATEMADPTTAPYLLCLVNPGSGGQAGAKILTHLKTALTEDMGMVSSLVARGGEVRYEGLWFQWHILDDLATRELDRPLAICGTDDRSN